MPRFEFTLVLRPLAEEFTPDVCNRVYEACGEVEFGQLAGVAEVEFVREAVTFEEAVRSAIADIRKAGLNVARVSRPDQGYDEAAAERINRTLAQPAASE